MHTRGRARVDARRGAGGTGEWTRAEVQTKMLNFKGLNVVFPSFCHWAISVYMDCSSYEHGTLGRTQILHRLFDEAIRK
jgi:hypothetical protein